MRFLFPLAALALVATLPAAHAQDACTQASPCPWDIAVDQPGFIGESSWNWTAGDWMLVTVSNTDNVTHTVTLAGYGLSLSAAPDGGEKSQAIQLTQAGTFQLADSPSGDTVPVHVINGDVVDYQKGLIDTNGNAATTGTAGASSSAHRRLPDLGLPLVALALVGVALARRAA
jgi:hypothetical protein